jgi:alpha-ketoglutarate-dependent taurine dioxygenase
MEGSKRGDMSQDAGVDWNTQAASVGYINLPGGVCVVPQTPLIGADIQGLDLRESLDAEQLASVNSAFLRYKVLMFRSQGDWKMNPAQHTRFCQQLSSHWGLRPDTPQKKLNHSEGLSVHPFLPWQRGYPHIWPTSSVTEGGQQYTLRESEDVENFEPFAGLKASRKKKAETATAEKSRNLKTPRPGSFGAAALKQDSVNNGANGFHFDDGFFHQPPSAVVLNALKLPKVGGDTIFTDMAAAYRGLDGEVQEFARNLTQTMGWRHAFPIWEQEAKRQEQMAVDDSFARHVEQLIKDYPPSLQPLVRQHPVTGELSIFYNLGFTEQINDVSPEEQTFLVKTLSRMAERPEYQVRMRWHNEGDVCLYDNRVTNHYAVADYGNMGPRALHHIALLGEPTKNAAGQIVG